MVGLAIDNITIALLSLLLVILLYLRLFSDITPLVHPLLLGKQSEVSAVRSKGLSGVYRSWATGLDTPLTARPANSLKNVADVVSNPAKARSVLEHRLSNDGLQTLARTLAYALPQLFLTLSGNETPILSLLSAVHSLPILLLALSRQSTSNPLLLLSSNESFTNALLPSAEISHRAPGLIVVALEQLEAVVEQVINDNDESSVGILVIGAPMDSLPSGELAGTVARTAAKQKVVVKFWEDVWSFEDAASEKDVVETAAPSDVHSFIYDDAGRVLTVTHENLTAGIAGIFSMFPADKRPTALDVVVSCVPLNEAFGLSLALGCIWAGAGFRLLLPDDAELAEQLTSFVDSDPEACKPSPSMLFLTKPYLEVLTSSLLTVYRRKTLFDLAGRHKALALQQGSISRSGLFESLVWRAPRSSVLNGFGGPRLRACVLVNGSLSQAELAQTHLALSLPLARLFKSSVSAGPVTASHFYDLQCDEFAVLSSAEPTKKGEYEIAHVGAPSSNIELRLRFPHGLEPEEDEPIGGRIEVRGPAVLGSPGEWMDTGSNAIARTNGTFVLA